MGSARRYSTEAVVIRHMNYGEADRILTLYTPDHGKIHAIAKGIRRPKSRGAGHLDLFTRCRILVAQGRSLDIITQSEALEHFQGLRISLILTAYAHYASELLDAFVPDNLPNVALYRRHLVTLRRLADGVDGSLELRAFEVALLETSGYRPELHSCLGCGREILPDINRFSSAMGGVLCENCGHEDPGAKSISVAALKVLRHLQRDPGRILALQSMDVRISREVESRLREYIAYRLERQPKSTAIIATLESRLNGPSAVTPAAVGGSPTAM